MNLYDNLIYSALNGSGGGGGGGDAVTGEFISSGTQAQGFYVTLTIPEGIITFQASPRNFANECIKKIILPQTLKTIPGSVFLNTSLEEIDIPANVTSIGAYAFQNCPLQKITCRAINPPSISTSTFYNVSASCPIYVPVGSVEAYKAASGWSARADYIQAIS